MFTIRISYSKNKLILKTLVSNNKHVHKYLVKHIQTVGKI